VPHRILRLLPLSVLALVAATAPAHANTATVFERQTVATTNDVRADHGLRSLRRARCLARSAEVHARRMARRQRLFHQRLRPVQRECDLRRAAENVAVGYSTGSATVQDGWMESAEHRANILTRGHRLTAVGAVRDSSGRWWTVQLLGSR